MGAILPFIGNRFFAKEATTTIPIVMAQDGDPVANGFVASLARPGGNITGLANLAPELMGKQLELLKEIIPKLSRVAILGGDLNLHVKGLFGALSSEQDDATYI